MRVTLLSAVLFIFMLPPAQADLTPIQKLGQFIFFDKNLSQPNGQSCASCHATETAFVDPDDHLPVSEGVNQGAFGGRNTPSAAYAMYAPRLRYDAQDGYWEGGQFWDGRAGGYELDDLLAEQAMGPFLNPAEMANANKSSVVTDIRQSRYAGLFEQVWGEGSLDDVDSAYEKVARSIAAFERSAQFARFDSKYDVYLQTCLQLGGDMHECARGQGEEANRAALNVFDQRERIGMALFMGENDNDGERRGNEGAQCFECHAAEWSRADAGMHVPAWAPKDWVPPLFTDFRYDNLGVPVNKGLPTANDGPDLGIGPIVGDERENGKFKVMTLRNIAQTGPYAHNGFFTRLQDMVHYYNTRDDAVTRDGKPWPVPEVAETINREDLGNLGLSEADEQALVAFLLTLSDGYQRGSMLSRK